MAFHQSAPGQVGCSIPITPPRTETVFLLLLFKFQYNPQGTQEPGARAPGRHHHPSAGVSPLRLLRCRAAGPDPEPSDAFSKGWMFWRQLAAQQTQSDISMSGHLISGSAVCDTVEELLFSGWCPMATLALLLEQFKQEKQEKIGCFDSVAL